MESHSNAENGHKTTRRTFLKATGVLATGLSLGSVLAAEKRETLAIYGGPKAVTIPHKDATKWPIYGEAEQKAILDLVRNPSYEPLGQLEEDWKEYFGFPYARSHCNGTAALTSMYFALDLPPGSEVMVPSYTFFATIVPMRLFGLVPVFVDINPQTLTMDLEDVKKRLTKNTKAIVPVHWAGLPCDVDAICDWADQKGLIVLEDACQAPGAKVKGRFTGTWGRMGVFSFSATKAVPGIEGGMGVYQNQEDFERATAFGNYDRCEGEYAKYLNSGLGVKMRMHPHAAALARLQLKRLRPRMEARTKQVRSLHDRILQLPGLYEQNSGRKDVERVYYGGYLHFLFLNESEAGMSRAMAVKALAAEGVTAYVQDRPLQHKLPLYSEAKWWHHKPLIPDLPGSEKANAWAIQMRYFTIDQPEVVEELTDQYVKAFEKVWAHRDELAKA